MRGYRVPGRIEFLGKHTDYAGGRSLVCATEQGFSVEAWPLDTPVLRIGGVELPLRADLAVPRGDWSAYPATVVRRLARDFGPLDRGLEVRFSSDLPRDAGLSSSSALVVASALAIVDANALWLRPAWREPLPDLLALAGYLGAVENGRAYRDFVADGGVGTQGGSQDQTAILCSRPGALIQVGFDPVRFERAVAFPPGFVLAVAVSGVAAPKTREALALYNGLAGTAAELLSAWRTATGRNDPSLYAALASGPGAVDRLRAAVAQHPESARLTARLAQFADECFGIIPDVGDRLARGDAAGIGPLVDRSQAGAEAGLGNQIPETIALQQAARRLGAAAASAFGAGYGGAVWAMVAAAEAPGFLGQWGAGYRDRFPARADAAQFFTTLPAAPARQVAGPPGLLGAMA